jgi:hypothetical protein
MQYNIHDADCQMLISFSNKRFNERRQIGNKKQRNFSIIA